LKNRKKKLRKEQRLNWKISIHSAPFPKPRGKRWNAFVQGGGKQEWGGYCKKHVRNRPNEKTRRVTKRGGRSRHDLLGNQTNAGIQRSHAARSRFNVYKRSPEGEIGIGISKIGARETDLTGRSLAEAEEKWKKRVLARREADRTKKTLSCEVYDPRNKARLVVVQEGLRVIVESYGNWGRPHVEKIEISGLRRQKGKWGGFGRRGLDE